jgi:endogenous inhibitor of DNA gyrase (YacG/DUF329 family)
MPGALRCPICNRPVALEDPEMPFCSARCRLLDLGNWASERYTIPSATREEFSSVEDASDDPEESDGI